MDTTTKNESGTGSERVRTFDLVFAFPTEKTKMLKARALAKGFYFSGSDAGLYRSVMTFLSDVGFSDLPAFEKAGMDTKFRKVWDLVHANPTLNSNEIQALATGGKSTTNRVAISWLGSVLEHLGQHVPSVEKYRTGLVSVMSRPEGRGRQADPAKAMERTKAMLSSLSGEELLALLSPGQIEDIRESLKPAKSRERRK